MMAGTWVALRSELSKARHSPGSRLVLFATAAIGAARVGGGFLADRFAQARRMTSSLAAGDTVQVSSAGRANAYAPFLDGLATSLTVGVLLVRGFPALHFLQRRGWQVEPGGCITACNDVGRRVHDLRIGHVDEPCVTLECSAVA